MITEQTIKKALDGSFIRWKGWNNWPTPFEIDLVSLDYMGGYEKWTAKDKALASGSTHPNRKNPWKSDEVSRLIELARTGMGPKKIAGILGRSEHSVASKRDVLREEGWL